MTLAKGQRLGPYEILDSIASGGMGQVYKARDTRLERIVAVKVSSEGFGERFYREAKTIASLNHPHICTLHDVGKEGDVEYLVMEYIEGRPLKGPLPAPEVMRLGAQIADALDAAHQKGVTHRDLKPANILVSKGSVKVLDFGLARVDEAPESEQDSTLSNPLTQKGTMLGTLPYMAPEQVEGKKADSRTDIWAFGLVLSEMATGERVFAGKTQASLIASILSTEPPPIGKIENEGLTWLVARCLAKDREERWQSARDLRHHLLKIVEGKPAVSSPQRSWRWILAISLSTVLAATGGWLLRPAPVAPRFNASITPPDGSVMTTAGFDLSPDGRYIVFTAVQGNVRKLWLRSLDSEKAQALDGSDGAYLPFWSPDSKSIGFFASGQIRRIELAGGPLRAITNAVFGKGASWSSSGLILFAPRNSSPIFRVSASGGTPTPVTRLDRSSGEIEHGFPQWLPDGRGFIYYAQNADPNKSALMFGRLDESGPSTENRKLASTGMRGLFAPFSGGNGYLLFVRDTILMAQEFRPSSGQLAGDAIATPVSGLFAQSGINGFVPAAAGSNGILATQSGSPTTQLVLADRSGVSIRILGSSSEYVTPDLSPDGRRLLVSLSDAARGGAVQVWLLDLEGAPLRRLTFGFRDIFAVWNPLGTEFVFSSLASGTPNLSRKAVAGTAEAVLLRPSQVPQFAQDWSKDGGSIVYTEMRPEASSDLWVHPLREGAKAFPFLQTQFNEKQGQFSPEPSGPPKWIAYVSDESGADQVYVQPFRGVPASGSKYQVTTSGGNQPRWRGDGKELYFLSPERKMMAVPVKATGDTLEFGTPVPLFQARLQSSSAARYAYDVSPDGKTFVLVTESESPSSNKINLLVNWEAGLGR